MADSAVASDKPAVWAWFAAGGFILIGLLLILSTYGKAVPVGYRWGAVAVWALLTLAVGLIDSKLHPTKDSRAVDIWTIAHGFAGVVFGLWFVPFWLIAALTVLWEVFEYLVPGFGEKEIMINRAIDVGIALALWATVVLVVMLVQGGVSFPLAPPFHVPSLT